MKIQKGDKVLVITGKDRHKTGVVERVMVKRNKVIVTGVNMVKKHLKRSAKNPQGGIIDKAMPLDASNLMLLDSSKNKPTRIGYKITGKTKLRIGRLTGAEITKEKSK